MKESLLLQNLHEKKLILNSFYFHPTSRLAVVQSELQQAVQAGLQGSFGAHEPSEAASCSQASSRKALPKKSSRR